MPETRVNGALHRQEHLAAADFTHEDAERLRLEALDRYDILDTPTEECFERVTRLVRRVFDVEMSTLTFIDGHRQWFKSRQGVEATQTCRSDALCNYAIREPSFLVVEDTVEDSRFARNPFVVGEPHLRFYAGVPLRSPDGHAIGVLCAMDRRPRRFGEADIATLRDLARVVMSELELRQLASTDSLTGALSRRAFRDEGGRLLALAARHGYPLGCLLLDLDRFKQVNDRHGHAVGDRVLSDTAHACTALLRKSDVMGRLGGEEFAVLLPHTPPAGIVEVADKVRRAIAALRFAGAGGEFSVTTSIGMAYLDRSITDVDELLRRADVALYAAKGAGRDRCVEWQPPKAAVPSLRRRVLKAGSITFNGGGSVIDCTVRSLSDTGASLDVIDSAGVPRRFKLRIASDSTSRFCRVVHTDARAVDVEFL